MKEVKVFKFGGASIQNAAHIRNVVKILQKYPEDKLVIIISALGKTTVALEDVVSKYLKKKKKGLKALQEIVDIHLSIAEELGLPVEKVHDRLQSYIKKNISHIPKKCKDKALIYDQLVSLGELFSTTLVHMYLKKEELSSKWMDARNMILTDDTYREGRVNLSRSQKRIKKRVTKKLRGADIVITQGFIGGTKKNLTTTLAKEGSDYSAAIFAYALDVEEMTVWKDVLGIMTGDPTRYEDVRKINRISYEEAIEMTYYGAKVIHPKTIQPIQNKGIRLNVRSYKNLRSKGTVISELGMRRYPPITVVQDDVVLVKVQSRDFAFLDERQIGHILGLVSKYGLKTCLMRNSAISFNLCLAPAEVNRIEALVKELSNSFDVDIEKDLTLITVRHYNDEVVQKRIGKRKILLQEVIEGTIQMVVR